MRLLLSLLALCVLGMLCPAQPYAAPAAPPVRDSSTPLLGPLEVFPGEDDPPTTDPYVLLDQAKTEVGNGKLHRAEGLLAEIRPDAAVEEYVSEEVLLQRLLLCGAFMNAAGAVLRDASNAKYASSSYSTWLRGEHARYAQQFSTLGNEYMQRTTDGLACDFIRFRLPRVTAAHLQDIAVYADPQVLRAAVENWEEQKTGLGNGLIATQARVALVLEAAAFYDLPQASATIEGVSGRLRNGVPLTMPVLMDWLAQTAAQQGDTVKPILAPLAAAADARLKPLLASDTVLTDRYKRRNGQAVAAKPADPPAAKSKPKPKSKRRSNKRRR